MENPVTFVKNLGAPSQKHIELIVPMQDSISILFFAVSVSKLKLLKK
jgi:hypothetical protein